MMIVDVDDLSLSPPYCLYQTLFGLSYTPVAFSKARMIPVAAWLEGLS